MRIMRQLARFCTLNNLQEFITARSDDRETWKILNFLPLSWSVKATKKCSYVFWWRSFSWIKYFTTGLGQEWVWEMWRNRVKFKIATACFYFVILKRTFNPRKNLSTMKNWVIYIFHHTENDWMKIHWICISDGIKMLIKIYTKMHFIQIDSERCGGGIMVIFEIKLVARVRSGEDNLDE